MELGLSLGDASKPLGFMEKAREVPSKTTLGFCMGLSIGSSLREEDEDGEKKMMPNAASDEHNEAEAQKEKHAPFQLELLPHTPISRNHGFPWAPSENGSSEGGSCGNMGRGLDVNRLPMAEEEGGAASSSDPNSAASSFQMDFFTHRGGGCNEAEGERASSRASDEDENGNPRKKLRLSKEQSAFLEESFKEHSTLNPKQKLALAKQLGLRPRQVEVWFQNRRARTKLKQTEVDCEYLKRCCETLTEENRRLHKELQELRALKTSNPFYMQLPATTLTMCPSCERVATTSTSAPAAPPPPPATSSAATRPAAHPGLPIFSHARPSPSASSSSFLRNG